MNNLSEITVWLEKNKNPDQAKGKQHFGMEGEILGIRMPVLRAKAKELELDLPSALALWDGGSNEAKILSSLCLPAKDLTLEQAQKLSTGFCSWDVVDQFCNCLVKQNLSLSWQLVDQWKNHNAEYTKRAAFSFLAMLAVHDKTAHDQDFLNYLPLIEQEASDERNFVKKAVNWALRQIGKRNLILYGEAADLAKKLKESKDKSTRWIGQNADSEFANAKIIQQVKGKDESFNRR